MLLDLTRHGLSSRSTQRHRSRIKQECMDFKDIISEVYCERIFAALSEIEEVDDTLVHRTLDDIKQVLERLELKARVHLVAQGLQDVLSVAFDNFDERLDAVLSLRERGRLGSIDEYGETSASFELWPLTAWVGEFGLEHPEASLSGLKELTCHFTAEFDIRPFLEHHRELTLETLEGWRDDANKHVRRLVSEGTRAYLPWGTQVAWLKEEPEVVIELIRDLRDDPVLYVRRSVANNLNDITREHPQVVLLELSSWSLDEEETRDNRRWIMKHALRSLVKKGNEKALELLGFRADVELEVESFKASSHVELDGAPLLLDITLCSTCEDEEQKLVLDYVIHHVKSNGQRSAKVFKWKTFTLEAGEKRTISKKHAIKTITTRRYFGGTHKIDVQINGKVFATQDFELEVNES